MSADDYFQMFFGATFGIVFGAGIAVLFVVFIAAMMGFFDR